jgi:predicted nucleic acid-binding protein
MIAADTSTWIAFLGAGAGQDVELLDQALRERQLLMLPVVLTELLSDPELPPATAKALSEVPRADVGPGYWQNAGLLRARILSRRRKARLGDALIAQSCFEQRIRLLSRDRDFRAFAEAAGLELILRS